MQDTDLVPFTFKWEHPATEVFVTGTFDDWRKAIQLDRADGVFTSKVLLSCFPEKTYYKFVVDGKWTINPTATHEHDLYGFENNVITRWQLQLMKYDAQLFHSNNECMGIESSRARSDGGEVIGVLNLLISNDKKQSTHGKAFMTKAQHTEEETADCDLESIHSFVTFRDSALGSSLASSTSTSASQGLPQTAQEEILIIIISDSELRFLFEEAARRVDKPRFVRNVRRLFLLFHQDLRENAANRREMDALNIIQRHCQWLASRLFDICNPDRGFKARIMATYSNQQLDKRPILEAYLATMGAKQHRADHNKLEELDTTSDEDSEESQNGQEHIDYSKFPNLARIKNFLVAGTAFKKLKLSASQWIRPAHRVQPATPTVVNNFPVSTIQPLRPTRSQDSPSPNDSTISASTETTVPDADGDLSDDDSDLSYDPDLVGEAEEVRILAPKFYFD